MMWTRRELYPPNWKQLATVVKEQAGYRCERCRIRQGATRKSKRTGQPYCVYLHAAHVRLHDTRNPAPLLKCLCPTCHGKYDHRLRVREGRISLEQLKHRYSLRTRNHVAQRSITA